mmetsp:Transcript_17043/g.54182  ORF Transcript_17043/g.54182 Transcript_17043/m.54182 type:complete len:208 (-) Transcript_17043:472-1095(-)
MGAVGSTWKRRRRRQKSWKSDECATAMHSNTTSLGEQAETPSFSSNFSVPCAPSAARCRATTVAASPPDSPSEESSSSPLLAKGGAVADGVCNKLFRFLTKLSFWPLAALERGPSTVFAGGELASLCVSLLSSNSSRCSSPAPGSTCPCCACNAVGIPPRVAPSARRCELGAMPTFRTLRWTAKIRSGSGAQVLLRSATRNTNTTMW